MQALLALFFFISKESAVPSLVPNLFLGLLDEWIFPSTRLVKEIQAFNLAYRMSIRIDNMMKTCYRSENRNFLCKQFGPWIDVIDLIMHQLQTLPTWIY